MDATTRSIGERCTEIVDELPIPRPFSMDHFLRRLSDRRGKAIKLFAAALDTSAPCGLLVSTRTVDYVCFAEDTSPLHRQHIILHEIGHLEFGHEGHRISLAADVSPPDRQGLLDAVDSQQTGSLGLVEQLMPHLDLSAIRRLHNRTVYIADDEHEAELFATLAGDRISRLAGTPQGAVPRDMTVVRLRSLFDIPTPRGDHRG